MKLSKIIGVVAVAALALMAFASSASASTTLEVNGVKQTGAVTIKASAEGSILLTDTNHFFANTCKKSEVEGATSTFTGEHVTGAISKLTFEECTEDAKEKVVSDVNGSLTVTSIAGTTNGTVFSVGAKVTTPSPFGKLTCTTATGAGTHIGTLTGKGSGSLATMDIKAVLNCGVFLSSALWEGSYTVTSPSGLGVTT